VRHGAQRGWGVGGGRKMQGRQGTSAENRTGGSERHGKPLRSCTQRFYEFIGFGAMEVTKPYEFIGFGAMEVTKPYEFIGFGAMEVTKPYEFTGFGAMEVTKPYEFIGLGAG
jgi:hypothetical protein